MSNFTGPAYQGTTPSHIREYDTLQASCRYYVGDVPTDLINDRLAQDLVKQLKPYIAYQYSADLFHGPEAAIAHASLNVSTPEVSHSLVETNGYYLRDALFSKSDIDAALLNIFPERFI